MGIAALALQISTRSHSDLLSYSTLLGARSLLKLLLRLYYCTLTQPPKYRADVEVVRIDSMETWGLCRAVLDGGAVREARHRSLCHLHDVQLEHKNESLERHCRLNLKVAHRPTLPIRGWNFVLMRGLRYVDARLPAH